MCSRRACGAGSSLIGVGFRNESCDLPPLGRVRESLRAFADVFRNPALRRLELAWAGANLGTWAYAVGVAVFAYEHGGAKTVGIVGFARWGAAALVAPWLALLADRHPRRRVMIGADAVRACALALAAAAVWAGWTPVIVYVLAGVVAAAASAFHPAEAALRPSLAREAEELTAANVVSSTIAGVGTLGGPALGGLLLAVGGAGTVFAVSAGLMIWSAALVLAIRVREPALEPGVPGESMLGAAFAGFAAIFAGRRLRLVMGLFAAQLVVNGILAVLVVVLALKMLHLGEGGVGWLNAVGGAGGVVGALVAVLLIGRRRVGGDFALGIALWSLPLVAVGLWVSRPVAVVALVFMGVWGTVADAAGMTLLQRVAPEPVLARVFGVLETVILLTLGLGSLLAPALVAGLGDRGSFIAVGVALPVLVLLVLPALNALDRETVVPERQLALLRGIPMFAPLAAPELERLAAGLVLVEAEPMAAVVEQGAAGDRFYVVDDGRAVVEIDGAESAELGSGDYFGEIALLRDVPRTATVRAVEHLRLWALERELFLSVVTGYAPSLDAAEAVAGARLAGTARA
jgi:predicted MFS family arabinose efflux permease